MTRFYVVRHGETLFNRKNKVQGACDSPLTKNGIAQAEAIISQIDKVDFDGVYSSISERAFDTATIITSGKYEINITKQIKEMNFGYLEGEDNGVLLKPEHDGDWMKTFEEGFEYAGGESFQQVHKRLIDFISEVAELHPDGNVLLVSHGLIVTSLGLIADYDYTSSYLRSGNAIKNCSISTFVYDGSLKIEKFNQEKIG
ncbi:MAG: phosphoglycerate mutase family protein [Erysipelotrichaceae bacterium]|nr:phosphoglycerate mutase family protein [Erysipelotrichaceae bacterium]MDD3809239.1 phosphoglycerate mutase family protein [Erysipelotrichaceae bacterium]